MTDEVIRALLLAIRHIEEHASEDADADVSTLEYIAYELQHMDAAGLAEFRRVALTTSNADVLEWLGLDQLSKG